MTRWECGLSRVFLRKICENTLGTQPCLATCASIGSAHLWQQLRKA